MERADSLDNGTEGDTLASIIQPLYIPWMGYFGYIMQSEVFVFYDDVQFVRRSWQRRNRIKVPDGDFTWLTVPIEKDFGQNINEVEIKADRGWAEDHWKTIHHSYASTLFYDEYGDEIASMYEKDWESLVELNVEFVTLLSELFGLTDVEFVRSSELDVSGTKTERLINTLMEIDADAYISGPSARDYLDPEQFARNDIVLYWHEFDHPEYRQPHGEFVSHLSAVDLLFNEGENAYGLIEAGEEDALRRDPQT